MSDLWLAGLKHLGGCSGLKLWLYVALLAPLCILVAVFSWR